MSTENIRKIRLVFCHPNWVVKIDDDITYSLIRDDSINELIMGHLNDDVLIDYMGHKLKPIYEPLNCDSCILKGGTELCVNFDCSNLVFVEYCENKEDRYNKNISLDLAKRKLCNSDMCMYYHNCKDEGHLCLIDYLFKV